MFALLFGAGSGGGIRGIIRIIVQEATDGSHFSGLARQRAVAHPAYAAENHRRNDAQTTTVMTDLQGTHVAHENGVRAESPLSRQE
jgi:hypothetical protein